MYLANSTWASNSLIANRPLLILGWESITLQSSESPLQAINQEFHDHTILILIVITVLVAIMLLDTMLNTESFTTFSDYSLLEVWWTTLPGILLVTIAYPSLTLLYIIDEHTSGDLSTTVLGHQWYWEYNTDNSDTLESYVSHTGLRLLDVDNHLTLPTQTPLRFLVSRADVLHAWSVPRLRVKLDATPGRVSQSFSTCYTTGLLYGQCSEICGVNHSSMPIVLELLPTRYWLDWV